MGNRGGRRAVSAGAAPPAQSRLNVAQTLSQLRPVYAVGVGWSRYQAETTIPCAELGLQAVRDALHDASLEGSAVECSYVGIAQQSKAGGRSLLQHRDATGESIVHVESESASGAAAFRHACIDVASSMCDVALALGVDKPAHWPTGEPQLGLPNGAPDPHAQQQQARTIEKILAGRAIPGSLNLLRRCPIGKGATAVIVASEDAIARWGLDPTRSIRVTASATRTKHPFPPEVGFDADLTRQTTALALEEAGLQPSDLDVVELHDAFAVGELHYVDCVEAIGICPIGQAATRLRNGEFRIGGRVAVNPSGRLPLMGHPLGLTGVDQIAEITLQLRGEAGMRQQPNAHAGLAHMVELGSVCYVHVLQRA